MGHTIKRTGRWRGTRAPANGSIATGSSNTSPTWSFDRVEYLMTNPSTSFGAWAASGKGTNRRDCDEFHDFVRQHRRKRRVRRVQQLTAQEKRERWHTPAEKAACGSERPRFLDRIPCRAQVQ